jgi:hypothetical protein
MARTPAMNPEILNAALAGLEAQKERIEGQIAEIQSMLGRRKPGRPKAEEKLSPKPVAKKKRMMSAEGRARIAAATRKRWAEFHKAKAAAAAE